MEKSPAQQPPAVFGMEMHSKDPERLAAFYEDLLKVKFLRTAYPFPRYVTYLGRFALIIGDAVGGDSDSESEPGKITLALLTTAAAQVPSAARSYFVQPSQLHAGMVPGRYAPRLRDPDGNYLALASSMENLSRQGPPVPSWRELADSIRAFGLNRLRTYGMRARKRRDLWRDRYEYSRGHVAIQSRALDGYTHLVASREGLFAINTTAWKQLVRGRFFGVTVRDANIYCFQGCGTSDAGPTYDGPARGRLIRLGTRNNRICDAAVLIEGLDDGCHQIDFVGDDLLIVDCYNGRILKTNLESGAYEACYPLGRMSRAVARDEYHMNSIAAHPDGSLWLLLHNSNRKRSEIAVLNSSFELIRRFELNAGCAHNIVFTNDALQYLIADSAGGRILSASGPVVEGNMMMTRGLALDETTAAIGESFFSTRPFRRYVPGRVHFHDRRTWKHMATVELPAAPTEIRRIDGKDFSLSNYALRQYAGGNAVARERQAKTA